MAKEARDAVSEPMRTGGKGGRGPGARAVMFGGVA